MSSTEAEEYYNGSLKTFKKLRGKHERREANDIGGRSFILVSAVNIEVLASRGNDQNLLADLLQASYDRFDNRRPSHKPVELQSCLPIFYTLLDLDCGHLIHHFMNHAPPLKDLPIEKEVLDAMFPPNCLDHLANREFGDLARNFYNQQWHWCPLHFDCRMGRNMKHHEHVIPITARSMIKPVRLGVPNPDRKATLWVVEIPMDCVDLDPDADYPGQLDSVDESTKNYQLVIKQFANDHYEDFDRERTIFNLIRRQKGIVKYFGWYEHCEKDAKTGKTRAYYNLVLERGTQDLYSAFQKENPPITSMEIQEFWSSLFDVAKALASIQKIDDQEDTCMRYVWHGDIKPENILDVGGRFKLADPGEACVKAVPKSTFTLRGEDEQHRAQVPGGTKSFAAPEKNNYAAGPRGTTWDIPYVTQGIDIWSLGCVFSVAATYVVAGKEGVKQYSLFRQRALSKLNHGDGDLFHNTNSVLPEVKRWHNYIRTGIRTQDDYTAKVLDIVDDLMLIVPGESRISGAKLTERLADINNCARDSKDSLRRLQPPEDVIQFLDEVMTSTGDDHPRAPTLEEIPRTISQSGADMFQEALLYPSLRSEGRPPLPRNVGLLRTTLEQQAAFAPYQQPNPYANTDPSLHSGFETRRSGLPKITTVTSAGPPPVPDTPPYTFWEVEAELEQEQEHSRSKMAGISKAFSKRFAGNKKLVEGKEDQLVEHFKNRDLVYLVDNASTMASFWKHASYLLRVLVWRSLKLDEDGMELVFTTGNPDLGLKPKSKKKQKLEDFTKKMQEASPKINGQPIETDMATSLGTILDPHMKLYRHGETMKRGLTILVLTDGLWEANDDHDVEDYLATFIKNNKASWGWDGSTTDDLSQRRPISIQFIRFGHHPQAIIRLKGLDDDLKNRVELQDKQIPDMIDTENADGDVFKMFLGSFLEDMDNKLIQGGGTADTLSLYPPASAFGGHSPALESRRTSRMPSNHGSQPPTRQSSSAYRGDSHTSVYDTSAPTMSSFNADERITRHASDGDPRNWI